MSEDLNKIAATVIRQLQIENEELKNRISHIENSEKLVFDLYKSGAVAAEDLEDKLNEIKNKSQQEMEIMKQAMLLSKVRLSPFKLDADQDAIGIPINAEERFINALINSEE